MYLGIKEGISYIMLKTNLIIKLRTHLNTTSKLIIYYYRLK